MSHSRRWNASSSRSVCRDRQQTSSSERRTTNSSARYPYSSVRVSVKARVLRMARVWGDSARKVGQYQSHYLHHSIEEPFRQRGLRDNEALEAALREVAVRSGRSGENLLGWLYRRHAEAFETEHMFDHIETALEQAGVHTKEPRRVYCSNGMARYQP